MLLIKHTLAEIDFRQLMDIYIEGNLENGADRWPELSEAERLPKAEAGFRNYLETGFFTLENARYCIWAVEGRYVSALRLEPYRDGLLLEALETKPDCRRQGYARDLIQAVKAAVPGKIYSQISKRNTASLAVHAKCGFQRIAEEAVYTDGTVNDRCCTVCLERKGTVVWINGAYGSGKSTAAHTLVDRIPGAQHFSAEMVGNAVRENIKDLCYHVEFPEYPIWRRFVRELLLEEAKMTDHPIFVPMTVLNQNYLDEIFTYLEAQGIPCLHIVLETGADTTMERILQRGEDADCWCARQVKRCEEKLKALTGIHLDAQRPAEEVAAEIETLLNL